MKEFEVAGSSHDVHALRAGFSHGNGIERVGI
jgi:hypothetical protein